MKIVITFLGGVKVGIERDGTLHSDNVGARQVVETYMQSVPSSSYLPHPWKPMADELAKDIPGAQWEIIEVADENEESDEPPLIY
jgi:hypothetical protein